MTARTETRITNPLTRGEKGEKIEQIGAIDPASLLELGAVAGFGAGKYLRYNALRGINWSLSFDAMMRHALLFWSGEDNDEESGLPHAAHIAWHALLLQSLMRHHRELDDRPFTVLQ